MKAIIGEYSCSVYPTDEDIQTECKIGQGADTCIFITMSAMGGSVSDYTGNRTFS